MDICLLMELEQIVLFAAENEEILEQLVLLFGLNLTASLSLLDFLEVVVELLVVAVEVGEIGGGRGAAVLFFEGGKRLEGLFVVQQAFPHRVDG